jgi:hypothetical protein
MKHGHSPATPAASCRIEPLPRTNSVGNGIKSVRADRSTNYVLAYDVFSSALSQCSAFVVLTVKEHELVWNQKHGI